MIYDRENGILKMQGFDIGGQILISDACEITFSSKKDGPYEKAKEVKVIMEVETLKSWVEEHRLLDEIKVINL